MKKYVVKEVYNNDNYHYFIDLKDDLLENYINDVFLLENRDNGGINDDIIKCLIDDVLYYSDYDIELYYNNHYVNYIIDTIKPFRKISVKQASAIVTLLKDDSIDKHDFILKALSIIYCSEYSFTVLRGYSQSDWIECFYNSDKINHDFIMYIESVCFNTGKELFISDEKIDIDDFDPNKDDYEGCYYYFIDWFLVDDLLNDISHRIGIDKNEIELYKIKDVNQRTIIEVIY